MNIISVEEPRFIDDKMGTEDSLILIVIVVENKVDRHGKSIKGLIKLFVRNK